MVQKMNMGQTVSGSIRTSCSQEGVEFRIAPELSGWHSQPVEFGNGCDLALLVSQLEEEGYIVEQHGLKLLEWASFYRLASSPVYHESFPLLGVPPIAQWIPSLTSRGSLTDLTFSVVISGWVDPSGVQRNGNVELTGAMLTAGKHCSILPEDVWRIVSAIDDLRTTRSRDRDANMNRRAWATIRRHAVAVGANLSHFLRKTIVLTPDRLHLDLRKNTDLSEIVVEVIPLFDGAPVRWLEMFDRLHEVPEHYEIPDGDGLVHVLVSPEVRTVLREIRRMPGRRVVGQRAEAFIRNPFATLGPDAAKVIDPQQFEDSRESAGIAFSQFTVGVRRDEDGCPCECFLRVQETLYGNVRTDKIRFEGPSEIEDFLATLDRRIAEQAQCCHWAGFDLEILGDTPDQADILRQAVRSMRESRRGRLIQFFDLSQYSERIQDFGVEKPYYSPFIARKSEDSSWIPENAEVGIFWPPEQDGSVGGVLLTEGTLQEFREAVKTAQDEHRDSFTFPGCPRPIPLRWAKTIIQDFDKVREEVNSGTFTPKTKGNEHYIAERRGLVVKPNVEKLDYEERRGTLGVLAASPELPSSLLPTVTLLQHQLDGIAWLQHLWALSPTMCRGALLADDMGLGKTIQLLTFILHAREQDPHLHPFLVVAPVSLLDNWKEEIAKFFAPGAIEVLTLYGPALEQKMLKKRELEEELVAAGVTKLLADGWLGSAHVVLTTYETMRDLEFSLARQKWSVMICDEAQKIKNPNALVTRAAKKQNARLKIACTGTPVENSLTDIWCLFDFVQPGLLGPLKTFGERFRRPIECKTDDEKQRLEELRKLIEPQKLRRMKSDIAKDLPKKISVEDCRHLLMSNLQRKYYADAVAAFRDYEKTSGRSQLKSPLGLLQYLRVLCSDPRPAGQSRASDESIAEIERQSPKMAWLLMQLRHIESRGEKVIVFCEFRDLQRTLQRAISERFGFVPDVINGDTSTGAGNTNSRQKRIAIFQRKPGFCAIILSPLAVGFGVNIQAANHVVHFTRTWNPAKEDQATDRAYRIGQKKDVHVYYPVVIAPDFTTFDAKLDKLLEWKRSLSTDMLDGAGDVHASEFGDLEAPGGGNAFGEELMQLQDVKSLDGESFEAFCALLWSKQGFSKTIRTPRVGDGGVDIVAIGGDRGVAIQCKSSMIEGRDLGWDAIKDVAAGAPAYSARYPGVTFSKVAVTNQRFNQAARHQAAILHVALVEGVDLGRLLERFPVRRGELMRFLLTGWSDFH